MTTTIEIKNYYYDDLIEEDETEDASDFESEEIEMLKAEDEYAFTPDDVRSVIESNIKYTDNTSATVATNFISSATTTNTPKK
jgi:hypothetical protein